MKEPIVLPHSDKETLLNLAEMSLKKKGHKITKESLVKEVQALAHEAYKTSYTPNPELGRNASPRFTQDFYQVAFPSLFDPGGFVKTHCRTDAEARQCEYFMRGIVTNVTRNFIETGMNIRIRRGKGAPRDKSSVGLASERERVKIFASDSPEEKEKKIAHNKNVEIINYKMMYVAAYVSAALNKLLQGNMFDIEYVLRSRGILDTDPNVLRKKERRMAFAKEVARNFKHFFGDYKNFIEMELLGEDIMHGRRGTGRHRKPRETSPRPTTKQKQLSPRQKAFPLRKRKK